MNVEGKTIPQKSLPADRQVKSKIENLKSKISLVPRERIELSTQGFSVRRLSRSNAKRESPHK